MIISKRVQGFLCLGVTSLIFGTFETVSKTITTIGPETTNFLRFFIGVLAIIPFALKDLRALFKVFTWKDHLKIGLLGTLFITISMGLYQVSLSKLPASTTVFLYTFNSVFIAIFAHFITKERLKAHVVVFITLSLVGLGFILEPGVNAISIYVTLPLLASCLFGLYNVLVQGYMKKHGRIAILTLAIFYGTIVNGITLTLRGVPIFVRTEPMELLALLYLGVFASGITYVTYYIGMKYTSINMGSIVFFMKPILSTLMAVIVLHETLSVGFLIGGAFILLGSFILIYYSNRMHHEELKLVTMPEKRSDRR